MATIVDSPLLNKKVLYVKGASEIVLSKCQDVLYESERKSVTDVIGSIEELLLHYQNQAMRTLGFAYEIIDDDKERICKRETCQYKPHLSGHRGRLLIRFARMCPLPSENV